ncbi:MAG: cyclic nucleotide-binding domain-containing protein [Chloroflexi bacterium]|nr:cyclic nucleotide-binding domain-containing protein [Chloroflexota bacterium]
MSPDLISALGTSWFGAGLCPETVARLAEIAQMRVVEPGDEVTREGMVTEALSIVVSGRVALRTLVPERGMVTILTVEPGDVVGWSAIVPPHRATSTGIAIEPVMLVELPGERLRVLLRSDSSLAASLYPRVLQVVSRRLTATRMQLLDLFAQEEWGRREGGPW